MRNSENKANAERGLKILALFIHRYRWGEQIRGDERGFLEKMRAYRDLGARVYVIELEPPLQQLMGERVYTPLRVNLYFGRGGSALEFLKRLLRLTLAAVRISRKVSFDVIYAYNQDPENAVPAYVLKLLSRKPMVLVFHLFYPSYGLSFRDAISARLSRGFGLASALLRSLLDFLRNVAFQGADLIICVSDSVREEVIRSIQAQGVVTVRNGVNTSVFKKIECPKVYDAVFLGRLCHQKGVDVLLNAWRSIKLEFGEVKLVLIGGGDREQVACYREMVRELGLEDSVELKGFVPDKELVVLLNSSKLFVFPSRYDGFALAVAEAMACGLPCVISDIPALRELYGEAAILVKPNDAKRLVDVIVGLLRDSAKREMLSRVSSELVREFDWEKTASMEINSMRALLEGHVRKSTVSAR
jgi:glycosyltransferase involved in cell wall biosynthesis